MSFDQTIALLGALCVFQALALALAIAVALFALIEARRWRAIAAAYDPMLSINGDPLPPYVEALIARLRKWGA